MPDVSEMNLERLIQCALLAGGADACPDIVALAREVGPGYAATASGGYRLRESHHYDEALCLDVEMAVAFVQATQPKEWAKLRKHYGEQTREKFAQRLARDLEKHGALYVLRKGIRDMGAKIRLVYFRPPSGLNPELQEKYHANIFTVVAELAYSLKDRGKPHPLRKRLDLTLFLNGIPLFTAELKNPLSSKWTYQDAIHQYKTTRSDPNEPLLAYGRCVGHFAVDPDEVWIATHLRGEKTYFIPFNQGRNHGAGNPIPPKSSGRFATAYLWEELWARDSVLDLLEHFIHEIEVEDDDGKPTGERRIIFPRYHQLHAVRDLLADARARGAGQNYLIQHSAGSGKSYTIAWLAHQLVSLHDAADQALFDSVVVVTDRRVLDRQLQGHVLQFEQTPGLVENIDRTSKQLRQALEEGKKIIITTLQKFPVIAVQLSALSGHRFALIIDEAHSSQSGEQSKALKSVLAAGSLEEAAAEEAAEVEDWEDRIVAEMLARGRLPNVSTFAFTATPKPKTLELFGVRQPDGTFLPCSYYSMRQAIQEGFILDVLQNYTTYRAYWELLKKAEDDPRYQQRQATALLVNYVSLHPHAIAQKLGIMVEHFHTHVAGEIGGQAKAMLVTRSRLHAVRYKLALDAYLKARGYPYQSLVAFSGTVTDPEDGQKYTESGLNGGLSERKTARTFRRAEYRFLVVANKFQTGFDEPLLTAMYVDKKLGGVNAVQTLSRLNRTHPGKRRTYVLDFANEADAIQDAFEPYYETTLLTAATDPHLLYDLQSRLEDAHLFTWDEVNALARAWFQAPPGPVNMNHAPIHNALQPAMDRFRALEDADAQERFRNTLRDYVRLYAFLSQLLTFVDVDLEKLYVFARSLLQLLPFERAALPWEILDEVGLKVYKEHQIHTGAIELERGQGAVEPQGEKDPGGALLDAEAWLSEIISLLNARYGITPDEAQAIMSALDQTLAANAALEAAARVNPPESVRLTFDQVLVDAVQDMLDANFKFYKLMNDEPEFAHFFKGVMFDRYMGGVSGAPA